MWDDFVWWLRELSIKKKIGLVLFILFGLFCVFWFRAIPQEILDSVKYADGSHNTRFVEGACRFYDDVVTVQGVEGEREVKSRDHFVSVYKNRFERDQESGLVSTRHTKHLKHRWTGSESLVQVVRVVLVKTFPRGRRLATVTDTELHWHRTRLGWRVHEVRILSVKRPPKPES